MMSELAQINVWQFEYAPEELQKMSENGGDEDWVILVPPFYKTRMIPWISESTMISVDGYAHPRLDGWTVYITAHS